MRRSREKPQINADERRWEKKNWEYLVAGFPSLALGVGEIESAFICVDLRPYCLRHQPLAVGLVQPLVQRRRRQQLGGRHSTRLKRRY